MDNSKSRFFVNELAWLAIIITVSIAIEFIFLYSMDMNPILSVKLQGLIGLMIIAYVIRASYRIWRRLKMDNNGDTGSRGFRQ